MDKTPFSVYDFFAYLSSGSVVVASLDYLFGSQLLLRPNLPPQFYVLIVILSYILGQIVAQLSASCIEQLFVKRMLGEPIDALLRIKNKPSYKRFIFPGFFRSLPHDTIVRVHKQMELRGCKSNGVALFFHCYVLSTSSNDKLQGRLDDFRNQYGFARNMAFAFFFGGILVEIEHFFGHRPVNLIWAIIAFSFSVCMLYRYLKFFRQYTFELLIRYSELPPPTKSEA